MTPVTVGSYRKKLWRAHGRPNHARLARNVGARGGELHQNKSPAEAGLSGNGTSRPAHPVESALQDEGRQPLVTTGCGYLPIGALPTGYLPIGALPTGGAGGGGSLRGRSAAAAALSMAKDAAVASTMLFIMTYSPCVWTASPFGSPQTGQPKRDAPLFPSPLSQSGFHRCTINDALTALTTQPKSACITGAIDPFQESVARIARTSCGRRSGSQFLRRVRPCRGQRAAFGGILRGTRSPSRFEFYSKHLESANLSSARRCDRYPGRDGGAMLRSGRSSLVLVGRGLRGTRILERQSRDSGACLHA